LASVVVGTIVLEAIAIAAPSVLVIAVSSSVRVVIFASSKLGSINISVAGIAAATTTSAIVLGKRIPITTSLKGATVSLGSPSIVLILLILMMVGCIQLNLAARNHGLSVVQSHETLELQNQRFHQVALV
jgi:hypothetical protein